MAVIPKITGSDNKATSWIVNLKLGKMKIIIAEHTNAMLNTFRISLDKPNIFVFPFSLALQSSRAEIIYRLHLFP